MSNFRGKIILSSIGLGGGIHEPPPNPCFKGPSSLRAVLSFCENQRERARSLSLLRTQEWKGGERVLSLYLQEGDAHNFLVGKFE